jgi:hypothetical protein
MSAVAVADLRERLIVMRADLVEQLAAQIDGGVLALLGSVGAALVALDAMVVEPE